jgi:Putative DNA-binding domain
VVRHASNISALIAAGESDRLEFKASLHHPHGPLPDGLRIQVEQGQIPAAQALKEVQKELKKAVTKTIAAFLNSQGGTLLIGVADSGALTGIEADFPYVRKDKQDADGWLLSLREVIRNALGTEVWDAIKVSLVLQGNVHVAVLQCPRRDSETWHQEGMQDHFYIRSSSASDELTGPSLVRYVREHWSTSARP